jgi:hypothetical protein
LFKGYNDFIDVLNGHYGTVLRRYIKNDTTPGYKTPVNFY